jgi:hypothetical protein
MNSEPDDSPEAVRNIRGQQLLFPTLPKQVCSDIGLNWWAAIKLWDDGWLSFDPASTALLDEAQESELRFLGSLVVAGCEPGFLKQLLESLHKPYSYRIGEIYFDWYARRWRMLPKPEPIPDREAVFASWVEELTEGGDIESLQQLAAQIENALRACANANTSTP